MQDVLLAGGEHVPVQLHGDGLPQQRDQEPQVGGRVQQELDDRDLQRLSQLKKGRKGSLRYGGPPVLQPGPALKVPVLIFNLLLTHGLMWDISPVRLSVCLSVCMSIMAPIALLITPGRRDPPLCVPSQEFFLAN